jgi:F-type H+-transporting ATPase subunit gamma
MATAREIRRRINSVGKISQVTRAMELIAATRLRRAQQRVLASRPYADKMRQVLAELERRVAAPADEREEGAEALHPLLERRPVQRVGIVLLTTDRGLCGALNSNVIRAALHYAFEQINQRRAVDFVVVGRKGVLALRRQPVDVVAEFTRLGDYPGLTRVTPIARVAMDAFTGRQLDEVVLVYPRFVSTLRQEPAVVPMLPIEPAGQAAAGMPGALGARRPRAGIDYIYEPDPRQVLAALLPRYVEVQVYQAVLELIASEFSARMIAMRNATDNALELVRDLQLGLNKARQATITREIIEVSTGAAAQMR